MDSFGDASILHDEAWLLEWWGAGRLPGLAPVRLALII